MLRESSIVNGKLFLPWVEKDLQVRPELELKEVACERSPEQQSLCHSACAKGSVGGWQQTPRSVRRSQAGLELVGGCRLSSRQVARASDFGAGFSSLDKGQKKAATPRPCRSTPCVCPDWEFPIGA